MRGEWASESERQRRPAARRRATRSASRLREARFRIQLPFAHHARYCFAFASAPSSPMIEGRVRSRKRSTIFSRSASVRLVRSARTSRTRLRSMASAMSPQMARMSASMSSYAAFIPTVSRFGRHLMGAEPRTVSNVEQDDEREDEEGVGQDRVGEEDAEPRAQAQCNPDRGEADAQAIQEATAHHPDAPVCDEEPAEDAARNAQDEYDQWLRRDRHRTDRPFMAGRWVLSLRPPESWVRIIHPSRRAGTDWPPD